MQRIKNKKDIYNLYINAVLIYFIISNKLSYY